MRKLLFSFILFSCLAQQSLKSQSIRSVLMNPPGTDEGLEYFEITGTAGASLTNMYFIAIEGDGNGSGTIDLVLSLGTLSLGSNGLLLWRDANTVILPAPSAETTVNVLNFTDIENGSNTFMIVQANTAPTVGTDLDTNNDGTFDVTLPWTSVLSAVSVVENDGANNYAFADEVGGTVVGPYVGYNPDFVAFDGTQWVAGDILGSGSGPYTVDPTRNNISGTYAATLTPGNTTSPLPVSLLYFFAEVLNNETVHLRFATESERNSAYFEIERSSDGKLFVSVGQLKSTGEPNGKATYQFADKLPLTGQSFYRLKQVDNDGSATYSAMRSVELKPTSVVLYPVPAGDILQVRFERELPSETNWQLVDANGRVVKSGMIQAEVTQGFVNISEVPASVYALILRNEHQVLLQKQISKQ